MQSKEAIVQAWDTLEEHLEMHFLEINESIETIQWDLWCNEIQWIWFRFMNQRRRFYLTQSRHFATFQAEHR